MLEKNRECSIILYRHMKCIKLEKGYGIQMKQTGIMIEGGAMRSVFAAGVLDFLMEKGIEIPNVLAVSAGAYAGMNYVSGQKGRAVDAVIKPLLEEKYMGPKTFLKKGTFFDMDYLFDEVPRRLAPFDFETFKNSAKRFIINTTNCITGESVYFEEFDTEDKFWKVCRTANSLPFISKITDIDNVPMLDGGLADALPLSKAEDEGWEKLLVILTRKEDYRKKYRHFYMLFLRLVYHKYPQLIKTVADRADKYNTCLQQIERMQAEGRALVFRPSRLAVGNNESDVDVLMDYYRHGYEEAMGREEEIFSFLAT